MSKKQKAADGDDVEKKSAKVKLASVALCLALAGGGYVMGGRGGAAPAAADGVATTETTVPTGEDGCILEEGDEKEDETGAHKAGYVVDLPGQSINLADGHYLRVAVALGLCPGVKVAPKEGGGKEKEPAGITLANAPAQDIVLETLSGASMEELSTDAGRNHVKEQLAEQIRHAYPTVVADIYFIEFVMQ